MKKFDFYVAFKQNISCLFSVRNNILVSNKDGFPVYVGISGVFHIYEDNSMYSV